MNKVVVRFADGRILNGFTNDFMPAKDHFHVALAEAPPGSKPVDVQTKDLKALFFVKEFAGDPRYERSKDFDPSHPPGGRKIKVLFKDGETMVGTHPGLPARTSRVLSSYRRIPVEQRALLRRFRRDAGDRLYLKIADQRSHYGTEAASSSRIRTATGSVSRRASDRERAQARGGVAAPEGVASRGDPSSSAGLHTGTSAPAKGWHDWPSAGRRGRA